MCNSNIYRLVTSCVRESEQTGSVRKWQWRRIVTKNRDVREECSEEESSMAGLGRPWKIF